MSGDELYLRHVLDAISKVERYVTEGYEESMAESHWQDAVIRQFEIIREAVKRLSSGTTERRPDRDHFRNPPRPSSGTRGSSGGSSSILGNPSAKVLEK